MYRFLNSLLILVILGCPVSCPWGAAQFADRDAEQSPAIAHCSCCPPVESGSHDSQGPLAPASKSCQCFCSGAYSGTVPTDVPRPQENLLAATFHGAAPMTEPETTEEHTDHNLPPDLAPDGRSLRLLIQSLTC